MEPRVSVGDVVVSRPVDAADLRPGAVVVFADPDDPQRTVTHRVTDVQDDGSVITRGDANATDDSSRVPPADVKGLAVLQVPHVGLPAWWWQTGRWRELALTAVLLLALSSLVPRTGRPPRSQDG